LSFSLISAWHGVFLWDWAVNAQVTWLELLILFAGSLIVIWIGLNLLRSRPEMKTAPPNLILFGG
jgi:arginine exporter protein ArgO